MKKKNANPILVILIAALIFVALTAAIILLMGYRYTMLDNGAKFIGESENGQPVLGTIKYQTGATAELDYFAGTITYSNGDLYQGAISGGCRNGYGVMTYAATGDVYEGTFVTDEITGSGTFRYANGDVYQGSLLNSQKHGYGVFTSVNGNHYEGNYEYDVKSGEGTFTWSSGTTYTGSFLNDVKHGYGIMVFAEGDRYEGYFKDDMRDGSGLYIFANGERYLGTFRNNLMDTRAVDAEGNFMIDSTGEYVHGEQAQYTFATGRVYTGYFMNGQAVGISLDDI